MVLCVDCGNTLIKCGLFGVDLVKEFAIDTDPKRSKDQYASLLKNLIGENVLVEGAIISSVVPSVTTQIREAIKLLYGIVALILNKSLKTKINIKIDYSNELGSDLLSGAVGALAKFKPPFVVADLGTATKMYVVDKEGNYIGGMITVGMGISLDSLIENTSLLMNVPLIKPKKIIGRNTKDSIQSGIVFGQAYMISEFARRMEKELGYELERILTGGFSGAVKEEIVCFHHEPNLVLNGLFEIYKYNIKE